MMIMIKIGSDIKLRTLLVLRAHALFRETNLQISFFFFFL